MAAPVEAASPQVGERLPAALHQRNRDVSVAARPHDLVAEHESGPVLDDVDRNAELGLLAGQLQARLQAGPDCAGMRRESARLMPSNKSPTVFS